MTAQEKIVYLKGYLDALQHGRTLDSSDIKHITEILNKPELPQPWVIQPYIAYPDPTVKPPYYTFITSNMTGQE